MPTDYSNFTTPDNTIDPGPSAGGQKPSDDAYWDPVQKRWLGKNSGDGRPMPSTMNSRPPGTTWDMDSKSWVPVGDQRSDGSTSMSGGFANGDATTAGRVEVNTAKDGHNSGGSWGGYSGTMVRMPDGKLVLDTSLSGRQADVDRFRGLGATAAGREAYKTDYTQANEDAAMAAGIRSSQNMAANISRNAAMGGGTPARDLGWKMLRDGANTQQAAAASTRGGSLAQMAAMRTQQNGQAAYMQQGTNQMAALRADEMAAGRAEYMNATSAMRAGDATAQNLHNKQTTNQIGNEIDQRGLNQEGQMGYESMAQNVNKAAQDAALKNKEMKVGIDAAAALRAQQGADRDVANAAAAASAAGAGVGAIADSLDSGGESDEEKRKRAMSDMRSKTGVRSLASVAMSRGGR